ncbi:hypothetical protein AYI68_g3431, partial [Smittium mucronatum]
MFNLVTLFKHIYIDDTVQIDHLGLFSDSSFGNRHLLVCIERLTGYPWAWAVPGQTTVVTCKCLNELVAAIGSPRIIHCNNVG